MIQVALSMRVLHSFGHAERPNLHGTTVATNALLEAKGAKIGLITNSRDVHVIRRQNREDLFALEPTQFPSLVSEDYVYDLRSAPEPARHHRR